MRNGSLQQPVTSTDRQSRRRKETNMKNDNTYVCPRCDYALVPVHAIEDGRRRIIALTCPEPYCDHMQMLPPQAAREVERQIASGGTPDRQIQGAG
jgi:hypothetical protein